MKRNWPERIADAPRLVAAVLMLLLVLHGTGRALEVPAFHGYVNDFADLLTPATEKQLEQTLQSFDLADSTQIAILTVESLEGDNLEQFSIRVADSWKIGQKGKDNGVLLLIAEKERAIRLEVGRGLEGVLTDLAAGRIIDLVITPLFREGRFDEGVVAGVNGVIQMARGEYSGVGSGRDGGEVFQKWRKQIIPGYIGASFLLVAILWSFSVPVALMAGSVFLLVFVFWVASFNPLFLAVSLPVAPFAAWGLYGLLAGSSMQHEKYSGSGRHKGKTKKGKTRAGRFASTGGRSSWGHSSGAGGGFSGFGGGGFSGGGASGRW